MELVLPMTRAADDEEFECLMCAHERQVLGVALRLTGNLADAQDAAQEVFLRLHRSRRSLREEVGGWLYRVTVNVCSDLARRRRVRAVVPLDRDVVSGESSPELAVSRKVDSARIDEALMKLGERERAALVLRDLEGLSTAEVAEVLGSAEATVRVQISKARLKLRELLRGLR
jgi:RNA polymerase sigma-70 factor (ECF subfamily)